MTKRITAIFIIFLLALPIAAADGTNAPRLITIRDGIKKVLEDSHLVKISEANKEISAQEVSMARSPLLPQVNASFSETFLNHQPTAKFGILNVPTADRNFFSLGADVYQTIFDFGKSYYGYKASKALLDSSVTDIGRIKNIAVLEFIITYFDCLDSEKMVAVNQSEIDSISSYLKDVQTMYDEGAAVKNDLLSAEVRLSDAQQRLITARNLKDNVAAKLCNILVIPMEESIAVSEFDMAPPEIPALDHSYRTAEEQRPEIKIVDDQIRATSLFEKSNRAKNYPELFADGGYSMTQNRYMVHDDALAFTLGVKVNAFDGGLAKAEADRERFRRAQLEEERKKLVDDVKLEVKDSFNNLNDAAEKVKVTKEAVAQAEENVRLYREKYADGSATSTEVLDSITMQKNAQTNYYRADYELKRSYARLMYSMGIDLAMIYEKMENTRNGEQ